MPRYPIWLDRLLYRIDRRPETKRRVIAALGGVVAVSLLAMIWTLWPDGPRHAPVRRAVSSTIRELQERLQADGRFPFVVPTVADRPDVVYLDGYVQSNADLATLREAFAGLETPAAVEWRVSVQQP